METDEPSKPGRSFFLVVGIVVILSGALLAAELAVPLQPKYSAGQVTTIAGVASIVMPTNAAVVNFSPSNSTVVLGVNSTVKWTNEDSIDHTVVLCPEGAAQLCPLSTALAYSGVMAHGDTFTVTFNSTGRYYFYCNIHPSTMRAEIVVKSPSTSNSTTTATT